MITIDDQALDTYKQALLLAFLKDCKEREIEVYKWNKPGDIYIITNIAYDGVHKDPIVWVYFDYSTPQDGYGEYVAIVDGVFYSTEDPINDTPAGITA